MNYTKNTLLIRCLSNLHAGSGKNDYGAIDNLVQRDATSGFPCIHDSSLKGALRHYFEKGVAIPNINLVNSCFGKESKTDGESEEGNYIFQQAHLLSIPVRSNTKPYFLVTCPLIISETAERLGFFEAANSNVIEALQKFAADFDKLNSKAAYTNIYEPDTCLEEEDIVIDSKLSINLEPDHIKNMFGNGGDFVVIRDELFSTITDNMHLPVIARNRLDNGISKALWYEQLVPRESRYLSLVLIPEPDTYKDLFLKGMLSKRIQIGANATVGYGQCLFSNPFNS